MKMALPAVHSPASGVPTDRAAAVKPAFDAAKVARMAKALADGSFRIDAYAIADRLLLNARRLAEDAAVRRRPAARVAVAREYD